MRWVPTAFFASSRPIAEFFQHLVDTDASLRRQGKRLVFKPYPEHLKRSNICQELAAVGIETISNDRFVERLRQCAAAIVEPSSAALVPAFLGVPMFLAQYGKLASQKFGEVLKTYPRAMPLDNIDRVTELLEKERERCDAAAVRRWIDVNVGPLPASDMPRRVANVFTQLIESRRATAEHDGEL